ncbi:hypothetical protein ACFYPZ_32880 [Streptomyces sp. NPDC005506]|uniref:MmyB family transcriptional regulator n=1 Tax=unclassified Streptomyces TaxID=2593676 RepID=UPI003676E40C
MPPLRSPGRSGPDSLYRRSGKGHGRRPRRGRRRHARHRALALPARQHRPAELVGEHFRRWWDSCHVAVPSPGTKTLTHPIAGEVTLDWSFLTSTADPDEQLITLAAEPGTPSL